MVIVDHRAKAYEIFSADQCMKITMAITILCIFAFSCQIRHACKTIDMLNQIKAVCAISHQTITMIAWLDEICASGMTDTITAPVILKNQQSQVGYNEERNPGGIGGNTCLLIPYWQRRDRHLMQGDRECAHQAERLIIDRDRRYALFPSEIFDEYAWNMLLHLFVSLESNRVMTEASLCELSHAPQSVGRRWIRHLVDDDQIEARHDGDDVVLTSGAIDRFRQYLRPMAAINVTSPDRHG